MRRLALLALLVCAPVRAADPPAKLDRHGDPLPAGALMRLGTLRTRAPITGFGIEKDGTVVTVGPGADVRRWHPTDHTGRESVQLPLPDAKERADSEPQVSPDGRFVAVPTRDQVIVWEVPADPAAKPKQVAAFAVSWPGQVCFAPDGSKLVVAGGYGSHFSGTSDESKEPLRLCDLKTGKMTDLEGGKSNFGHVSFSGDGKRVVGRGYGRIVHWDAATAKKAAEVETDKAYYDACALNPAADLIVAQPYQRRQKFEWHFFDAKTGKRRNDLTGPAVGESVSFAPDGKTVLVCDDTGVLWWDPTAGKLIRRFEGGASWLPVRFSPDGKTLVATSRDLLLRWDSETGKPLFPEQATGHTKSIIGLGVSPDGKRIATREMENQLCMWDAATGELLWHTASGFSFSSHVAFSPDGKALFANGSRGSGVVKRDAATGKELLRFVVDPKAPRQPTAYTIRVSPDGKTVRALTTSDEAIGFGALTAWDAATGERLKSTRVSSGARQGGEFSPDGAFLAGSGRVEATANQLTDLLHENKIQSDRLGQFSDDGKWFDLIAHTTTPGGAHYWAVVLSTATWKPVGAISVVRNSRTALSPDGKALAVATDDNISVYDVTTGKSFASYLVPVGAWKGGQGLFTHALRFTPDGTKLVTGHADTTALVWPVPPLPAK